MNLKLTTMVTLAGLAVASGGCGNLSDPSSVTSDHYLASAVSVRYASDGTLVVYATSVIDTYAPDLAQPKVHVPLSTDRAAAFSVSDDGQVAVVGASTQPGGVQTLVQRVDLSTGGLTSSTPLPPPPDGTSWDALGLTLSPAGDLWFVVEGHGPDLAGAMFDASSGAQLWTIAATPPGAEALFSSDGSTLYTIGTSQYRGGIQKMDSRTGAISLDAPVADVLQNFGGMSDPNTLIGVAVCEYGVPGSECTAIEFFSTADGSVTNQFQLAAEYGGGGMIQPPAFRCAVGAGVCVVPVALLTDPNASQLTQAIQVWSLDGRLVQSLDVAVGDTAISPDGQYVAVVVMGDVAVYRVSDGSRIKLIPYRNRPL